MAAESRTVVVRLSLDTAQAIRDSKQFGDEFDRALDKAEKRSASTSKAIDQIGATAGKTALAAGAALTAIAVTTANFDEAMSHVAATGDDARASFDELREAAIQAGQSTAFSATEAAGGIENLAKAGVSAKDILDGGLSGALDLAAAGGLEVADAAEVAATALTQFKLEGQDVPHVADLLAAAAGKAQGDVTDMAFALKQSGLVASQMGLSIEETTGTLAAFASAGLLGSDAGTSFRTMLLRLANPTKESAELMAQLGIQAYDAQGNFVGMASVSEQLKAALQSKTQAERDSALATIFGSDAIRAASVLYTEGAAGIDQWTKNVNDTGYAAETAATRMDNLKGDVEQLKGALETAFIGAGDGSTGALRDITQGLTSVVNAFNDLPPSAQSATTALLAVTAVTSGGLWFGSKVIRGVADTKQALDDLELSATRTGRALKGLSAFGAAAGVVTGLTIAVAELVRETDKAAPSIDGLTRSLLGIQDLSNLEKVGQDVGDLHKSIELLADPGLAQDIGGLYDKVPLIGSSFADAASAFGSTVIPMDDVRQSAREAATSIDAIDEALAGIVAQGSPEQAAKALDDLSAAYNLSASEQEQLVGLLPKYQDALDASANATTLAAGATDDFGVSARQAEQAALGEADALTAATDAMRDHTSAALDAFGAETQWREALKAAREQGEKTNAGIKGSSDAALENRRLIESLAAAWNSQSEAVKNNGGRYRQARQDFYDAAIAMGVGKDAAKALAGELLEIPKSIVSRINVEDGQAHAKIASVGAWLDSLDGKTARTYIDVIQRGFQDKRNALPGSADGSTVPKGGAYVDKHLYLLAPGEEVVSNRHGQADRHRPLLKAINAGRLADGGTTGARSFTGLGYNVNLGPGVGGAVTALGELRSIVRGLNEDLHDAQRAVKAETRERDRLQTRFDIENDKLGALFDQLYGLTSTITDNLTSDQFAGMTSSDPWRASGGIQSAIDALNKDTANAQAYDTARTALAGSLSGDALESILSQGLGTVQAFAGASPEQLAAYQSAFDTRANQVGGVAAAGAGSVYGEAIATQAKATFAADAELKASEGHLRDLVRAVELAEKRAERAEKQRDELIDLTRDRKSDAAKQHKEAQKKLDEQATKITAGVNGAGAVGTKRGGRGGVG